MMSAPPPGGAPPQGAEQPQPQPEVPLREDSIQQAITFLRSPAAAGITKATRDDFLKGKLTQPEIDELMRREAAEEQKAQAAPPRAPAATPPAEPASYPQQYQQQQQQQQYAQVAPRQQPQYQRMQPWQQGNAPGYAMTATPQQYYQSPPGHFPGPPQPPPMQNYMPLQAEPEPTSWLWLVGGAVVAAAATFGAIWKQSWSNEEDSPWVYQELERLAADERHAEHDKKDGQGEGVSGAGGGTDSSSPPEHTGTDMNTKEAFEDLVSLLRQHSEEAHENALAFKKATTTMQEQFQSVLTAMEKFTENQEKAQRTAKPEPLELSASTIQALANILQSAPAPATATATAAAATEAVAGGAELTPAAATPEDTAAAGTGSATSSSAAPSTGAREPPPAAEAALGTRDQFDAINQNLQKLVQQSQAKAEASKSMQTLSLILQNCVNNPSHEKHRKVNTTGSRFQELFSTKSSAAELLKLAGFVYQEPNFILPQEKSTDAALVVRDLVSTAQSNLEQMWTARVAPEGSVEGGAAAPANAQEPKAADAGAADGTQQLQQSGAAAGSAAPLAAAPADSRAASEQPPPAAQPAKPWLSNAAAVG